MRILIALALIAALVAAARASELKSDEEILFFRTVTTGLPGQTSWDVPIKGWVFEPERDSFKRRLLLKALAKVLGLPAGSEELALFQARADLFLVDSESRKDIKVRFGVGVHALPRSDGDGMFGGALQLTPWSLTSAPPWVRYTAELPAGDTRRFEGTVQVAAPGELGVISDIDDTLKVTFVKNRTEMLKNTFLRPFQAVPGMAQAYERWARAGATFHYVSGSPYALYPHLVKFMDDAGFPQGSYHLKASLLKKSGEPELTGSTVDHKIAAIESIFKANPGRKYVLVGDSGEKDPEIYGEVYRRHADRVKRIHIRRAPLADESTARYEAAFKGVPADLWSTFAEPQVPSVP